MHAQEARELGVAGCGTARGKKKIQVKIQIDPDIYIYIYIYVSTSILTDIWFTWIDIHKHRSTKKQPAGKCTCHGSGTRALPSVYLEVPYSCRVC